MSNIESFEKGKNGIATMLKDMGFKGGKQLVVNLNEELGTKRGIPIGSSYEDGMEA